MKLNMEVVEAASAPFPAPDVVWVVGAVRNERVVLLPRLKPEAVRARLDAVCPGWEFTSAVQGSARPSVSGSLTVHGLVRMDLGEADSIEAATDEALRRCAQQFGIGSYLLNMPLVWRAADPLTSEPLVTPSLPEWALPAPGLLAVSAAPQPEPSEPLGIGSFVRVTGPALDTLNPHAPPTFVGVRGLIVDVYEDGDWYVYLHSETEGHKFPAHALTLDPEGRAFLMQPAASRSQAV